MGTLTFLETVTGPFQPYGSDILGLEYSDGPSGPMLTAFAGYGIGARLVEFTVTDNIGYVGQDFLGSAPSDFVSLDFGTTNLNLSVTILDDLLDGASAILTEAGFLTGLNSGQEAARVAAVGVETGGGTFLVSSWPNGPGLVSFRQMPDGSLDVVLPVPAPEIGAVSDLSTVFSYGQTWVLAASSDGDSISSYRIGNDGALTPVAQFGAADGLGVDTPTQIDTVLLEGQPYVVMASAGTGSLSVLRLEADGSFIATDHILDNLYSRFADTMVLETVTVGDATFVMAAGSDDGFTLFRLRPDGKLFQIASVSDTTATTLDNVSAAALGVDGGVLRMFLASSSETGVSQFALDISALGFTFTGTSEDDVLAGGNLDDLIMGGAGDDSLSGGAGDDLIVDGNGSDTLTGGAGADVFTFDPDGDDDTITDFQRGIDSLDLSHYPLLYNPNSLGFMATSFGARLSFQGEILEIVSSDGNPLTLADLVSNDPFNVDRPPLVLGGGASGNGQTQIGAGSDDTLYGTVLDDILTGNGGDDLLTGGQGADTLMGGMGFDTAGYATATQAIILDRANPELNTGDAAGDVFVSIEAIAGTGFADQLRGRDTADSINGANGSDLLDGRGGNDILFGGFGIDTLIGGAGADLLNGGSDTDQASYETAPVGLRVDLAHPERNTGDATGDEYLSIENLGGSGSADAIYGDGGANTILGRGGDDWIVGRGGDDALFGGAGNDVLDGGAGADSLNGGAGQDRAQYFMSKQGLTVDLANPSSNTGIAAGDSYVSIEDIAGSRFDDQIFGNSGANRLFGSDGDDTLNGAAGDDQLFGGAGSDVFQFGASFGQDRIRDFETARDMIYLDASLLGATPADGSALLSEYGAVVGTDTVIDFGNGNQIVLDGISDLSLLNDVFVFF